VVGNPELGGRIQPIRLVGFSRTGWSDSPNSAFKAGPVVNTALPEITDVRSQVDTVIAEEVERLKSQIRDIQTREVEIVEALAEGTKIDKAALRLLQQTIKDVERLGQGVASRKRG
jgi:hypothetical protein